MKVIKTVEDMQRFSLANKEKQVGFVPTMGFFHKGHLSLMEQAKKENDLVVTSIFVNPLQFGPNEDFEKYPRNEELDKERAKQLGIDVLFVPTVQSMYPKEMLIKMTIKNRAHALCGKSRPGHFDGVITVLSKLFNVVLPDRVYFGMKDAQQLAIVDALIKDLNYPIQLIGLETVREDDGLAMSSRNVFLSEEERKQSLWLYKALSYGQQLIVGGETNSDIIVKEVKKVIKENTSGTIDYVEVLSYPDLQSIDTIDETVILAVAVHFDEARLIDNFVFNEKGIILDRLE